MKIKMNKLSKTILIFSIAVFAGSLLLINPVQAQTPDSNDLIVNFIPDPLFSEGNFLPGDAVSGTAEACNNSGVSQQIITEAIEIDDPDNLAEVFDLEIKDAGNTYFDDTLAKFFDTRELKLSILADNACTTYEFSITFQPETGDDYQAKELKNFDIIIGFSGDEGGEPPPYACDDGIDNDGDGLIDMADPGCASPTDDNEEDTAPPGSGGGGGGGGGGGLPPGLTIQYETTACVSDTDAIITWLTSYNSTSRVVYDIEPKKFNLSISPNYGYAYSTVEEDTPANTHGVTGHTVKVITGLSSGTTYYYRCVSHASPPTIGTEHSFTTLAAGEGDPCSGERKIEEEEEEVPGEEEPSAEEGPGEVGEEVVVAPGEPEAPLAEEGVEEMVIGPGEEGEVKEEGPLEEEPTGLLGSLLASIGDAFGEFAKKCYSCLSWWFILILALYPLYKLVIAKEERKISQKEKIAWLGWLSFLVILALYCYFANYICVQIWVFLILALITILLRHFFFSEISGFKNNFNLILGLIIILIFFIVWLILGCLPLWLILLLLIVYFFVPDFFRRREVKER